MKEISTEVTAYKQQKIKQEMHERRLLEEILKQRPGTRSSRDIANFIQVLLSFPCFQLVASSDYEEFLELSNTLQM